MPESFCKGNYLEEVVFITEEYSELCQTSKMERFAKIVNGNNQGFEYVSVLTIFDCFYQHQIFAYLFHCKICCHRKIFRQKGVTV